MSKAQVETIKVSKNSKNSKMNLTSIMGAINAQQQKDRDEWFKENGTFIRGQNGEKIIVTFAGPFVQRENVFRQGSPAVAILDFDVFQGTNPKPKILSWPCFPGNASSKLTDKLVTILGDKFTGKKIEIFYGMVGKNGKIGIVDLKEVV
jgi:hypothetical protein